MYLFLGQILNATIIIILNIYKCIFQDDMPINIITIFLHIWLNLKLINLLEVENCNFLWQRERYIFFLFRVRVF